VSDFSYRPRARVLAPALPWWRRWLRSADDVAVERLVAEADALGDDHVATASNGDLVMLFGRVVAVTLVPGRHLATVDLDDGTGRVRFETLTDTAVALLGQRVEVTGRLRRRPAQVGGPVGWFLDAKLIDGDEAKAA
jgi:hypothetical protein